VINKKFLIIPLLVVSLFASEKETISFKELVMAVELLSQDIKNLEQKLEIDKSENIKSVTNLEKELLSNQKSVDALLVKMKQLEIEQKKIKEISADKKQISTNKKSSNTSNHKTDLIITRKQDFHINLENMYTVRAFGLHMRREATTDSNITGYLRKDDKIEALCEAGNEWCYVPNRNSFVAKRYLRKIRK
jgi:hypothetical protein